MVNTMILGFNPANTMIRAMDDNRRFQRFIQTLAITDETNALYRQCSEMAEELWGAYEYIMSLTI